MANFTCLTCHVLFEDADNQREHYKTDWHRYNLKRKIVELQPVTKEVFKQKVDFQTQKKDEKVSGGKISTSCQICNKKFSSEKAFENHVKSKKHRDQEAKEAKKGNTADCNTKSKFALSKNKHFQFKFVRNPIGRLFLDIRDWKVQNASKNARKLICFVIGVA